VKSLNMRTYKVNEIHVDEGEIVAISHEGYRFEVDGADRIFRLTLPGGRTVEIIPLFDNEGVAEELHASSFEFPSSTAFHESPNQVIVHHYIQS